MFPKSALCAAAVIGAVMTMASTPMMAQEMSPVVTHHKTAAEHYEQAARHHREAAKEYEAHRMGRAAIHAHLAHGHVIAAERGAEDASMMAASNSEKAWKFWDAEADK